MKGNTQQEKRTPPVGMSKFKKAMLLTAIPMAVLFPAIPVTLVAAIIAAVVWDKKGQRDIARGIWTGLAMGIAIGVLGYGLTCFAILNNI